MKHYMHWSLWLWLGIVWPAFSKENPATLVSEPVSTGQYLQMVLGLLLVLGVIFALAWVIRRMGQFAAPSNAQVRVLGGISIGQRERVVVIQIAETQLVIGVAPGQVNTLHVFDKPVLLNEGRPAPESFAARLQAAIKEKIKP
ncbi:MAG: flagellar biosynthetic protein FliO [Gammaproteobacteria bacterium]